jgi:hypothetical protein
MKASIFAAALTGVGLCVFASAPSPASQLGPALSAKQAVDGRLEPVLRRGGGFRGRTVARRGVRGGTTVRRSTVARRGAPGGTVRRTTRTTVVRRGRWTRPPRYWWRPGAAVAAGAAIGWVSAATAAAWAGAAPGPDMCWYYTNSSRTQGFWDVCP